MSIVCFGNELRQYVSWLEVWVYMCAGGDPVPREDYLNDKATDTELTAL